MSKLNVLTQTQVEQFVSEGYVVLPGGFSRETAQRYVDRVWQKMELPADDPASWDRPRVHVTENLEIDPGAPLYTPRVLGAMDDLLGQGRWIERTTTGWWPVTFPGHEQKPWRPPESGWHIDGIHFHHHLDSPDQALLIIMLFADVDPGGGGTVFRPGSHRITAEILARAEPDGLEVGELSQQVNARTYDHVIEANGKAGDMVLLHPFMSHGGSANTGDRVRFITNNCIQYKKTMNVTGQGDGPMSPVERAICEALAADSRG